MGQKQYSQAGGTDTVLGCASGEQKRWRSKGMISALSYCIIIRERALPGCDDQSGFNDPQGPSCSPMSGPFFGLPGTPANMSPSDNTFALNPLIFSAGQDGSYDVNTQGGLVYRVTNPPNDPFYADPVNGFQAGMVYNATSPIGDVDGDGYARGWADNITNHDNTAQ
jgi:hypothetical protein